MGDFHNFERRHIGVSKRIDEDIDLDLGTPVFAERGFGRVSERRWLHRHDSRNAVDFEIGLECSASTGFDAVALLKWSGDSRAYLRLRRRRGRSVGAGGGEYRDVKRREQADT